MKKYFYLSLALSVLLAVLFFSYSHFLTNAIDKVSVAEDVTQDTGKSLANKKSDTSVDSIPDNSPLNIDISEEPPKQVNQVIRQQSNADNKITKPVEAVKWLKNIKEIRLSNWILFLAFTFFLMLICLTFVTTLLLKEVRWRRRHSHNESLVFPDAHLDVLDDLKHAWENLYKQVISNTNSSLGIQKENESLSKETLDSVSKFNSIIDSQKAEIDRLKEGYDFSIKKYSITALLEIRQLVSRLLAEDSSDETKAELIKVERYVLSYLEELDIESFSFESGTSIRDLSSDEYAIDSNELVDDPSLHETIKETLEDGYAFVHTNGRNVIKKTKIKIFKKEVKNG
jgi:hypothetical protein